MRLPNPILTVLDHFRPEFSRPTWKRVPTLIAGTLLARGRRTVGAALRAVGLAAESGFQRFHEVFSRAAWSPLRLARRLLGLLVAAFAPDGGLTFVIDETLERRRGPKITKRSHHRDPIASSKKMTVVASGLRWVVTALVVPIPWAGRHWALPVLSQLAPSEKTDKKQKRRHKTISQRAAFVARLLRRWLPKTDLTLLGDSTYSVIALGRSCQKRRVRLIASLPWKACLHHAPPPRTAQTMGRPGKVGAALTKLHAMPSDPTTSWTATEVTWPDGTRRSLELVSGQALWNESGEMPLPVRWVVVRTRPGGGSRGPSSAQSPTTRRLRWWPGSLGGGTSRRTKQTAPQATGGAPPTPPITIGIDALLELAAWCREHLSKAPGDIACPPPHDPSLPPAPDDQSLLPGHHADDLGSPAHRPPATTPRSARPASGPTPDGTTQSGGRA